ncbi:MAG: STAS domain-containing protein [Bacteroidota bacterium]|nr:STAS domain-containing protein [Bacteroidota bacterium]
MIFEYKSTRENEVSIFSLSGELIDRNQAVLLLEEVERSISENNNRILMNLENLRYLNSSGLNVLINILTKARKSGGDVAICCVNSKITELLVITKLTHVFNVCPNQEKALALLNK